MILNAPLKDFVVVRQHPEMLAYVDDLQRKNAEALAFYPRQVFEREYAAGRLFLGLLNNAPCGYVWAGTASPAGLPIHQACIQYDARRRLHGAAIVGEVENHARSLNAPAITLRCGFDLAANDFWQQMGYQCVAHKAGGARRMRVLNVWRKPLADDLFGFVSLVPARGERSSAAWSRSQVRGAASRFSRGAKLEHARLLVEAGA